MLCEAFSAVYVGPGASAANDSRNETRVGDWNRRSALQFARSSHAFAAPHDAERILEAESAALHRAGSDEGEGVVVCVARARHAYVGHAGTRRSRLRSREVREHAYCQERDVRARTKSHGHERIGTSGKSQNRRTALTDTLGAVSAMESSQSRVARVTDHVFARHVISRGG